MIKISEIFKTIGNPTHTYVNRDDGNYEKALKTSLSVPGKVCLITGPSKTGKSTLYQTVLKEINYIPLIVRCDDEMSTEEVWRKALEEVDFFQIISKANDESFEVGSGIKIKAELGSSWFAKIATELGLDFKKASSETELRQRIVSKPSSKHLIPILKSTNYILIIEDFHYLKDEVKTSLFQQAKAFVDSEISIIILGTTHHAVDLAYSNKDLVGRISQIEIGTWKIDDLKKIVEKGFNYLGIKISKSLAYEIATESVGLPILTQSVCFQLFSDKNILEYNQKPIILEFTQDDIKKAFYNVATSEFGMFEAIYSILATGFRKSARKYNTYELLLLIFTINPIQFRLSRFEIDTRLKELVNSSENFEIPPTPSINSTLGALGKLQKRNEIELLEWSNKQGCLFILEPSFLFYLRWKSMRSTELSTTELLGLFRKMLSKSIDETRKQLEIKFQ